MAKERQQLPPAIKHSSRLPCGSCGDGNNQGTGMNYDHGKKKHITCVVCDGAGWIYIKTG